MTKRINEEDAPYDRNKSVLFIKFYRLLLSMEYHGKLNDTKRRKKLKKKVYGLESCVELFIVVFLIFSPRIFLLYLMP